MQSTYEINLIYRRQSSSGDYQFGHNMDDFLQGQQAMRQVLQTRLRENQGEWWEGEPGALPYTQEILGMTGSDENQERVDLMVADRILDTVCVTGIAEQISSYGDRHYQCDCVVNTVYGDVPVNVEI